MNDKYKSNYDILTGDPFDLESDLYSTSTADYFENLLKQPTKKVKPKAKQKNSIGKFINNYSPKKQPETIVSMGARRKELNNKIKNSDKPSFDDLKEYHKLTDKIDNEVHARTKALEDDLKKI